MAVGLNPLDRTDGIIDSDGDGLSNLSESIGGTNPFAADSDGVSDSDDVFPLDPTRQTEGDVDPNGDTDNDGMPDAFESQYGLDPLRSSDARQDLDRDGLSNLWEYKLGSDPTNGNDAQLDADSDGFANLEEVRRGSDPLNKNSMPSTIDAWIGIILNKKDREPRQYRPIVPQVEVMPPL